jgi:hypothetical protein
VVGDRLEGERRAARALRKMRQGGALYIVLGNGDPVGWARSRCFSGDGRRVVAARITRAAGRVSETLWAGIFDMGRVRNLASDRSATFQETN